MVSYPLLTSHSTLLQPTRATVAMSSVGIGRGLAWKVEHGLDRSQLASVSNYSQLAMCIHSIEVSENEQSFHIVS